MTSNQLLYHDQGFLRILIFPLVVLLRATGGYSGWNDFVNGKTRRRQAFGLAQIIWCFAILLCSSVMGAYEIENAITANSCRMGQFLNLVSIVIGRVVSRLCSMFMIVSMQKLIEMPKTDSIFLRYFSRGDKIVFKGFVFCLTAIIALYVYIFFMASYLLTSAGCLNNLKTNFPV